MGPCPLSHVPGGGGVCVQEGSISRGLCPEGISVQGGLCPGDLCSENPPIRKASGTHPIGILPC